MRKTVNINAEDKVKLMLIQEKLNLSSETKTFSYLIANFENPKEVEKIVEKEKPLAKNEIRAFLCPAAIAFWKYNKELIQKHFKNDVSLVTNNALIYFLRKLENRYTLEAETIEEKK